MGFSFQVFYLKFHTHVSFPSHALHPLLMSSSRTNIKRSSVSQRLSLTHAKKKIGTFLVSESMWRVYMRSSEFHRKPSWHFKFISVLGPKLGFCNRGRQWLRTQFSRFATRTNIHISDDTDSWKENPAPRFMQAYMTQSYTQSSFPWASIWTSSRILIPSSQVQISPS